MMMRSFLFSLLLTLSLSACVGQTSKPAQFYVLQPDPGKPLVAGSAADGKLAIGLGPITLPALYDRPQIVTQATVSRIELAEYDRWGGDLTLDLERVLMQNLMGRLNTDDVLLYPWPVDRAVDFQVAVQFLRFDGQLGHDVRVEGVWRLLDGKDECQLAAHQFSIREATGGTGYPVYVQALGRGLAQLSQQIAETVVASQPGC